MDKEIKKKKRDRDIDRDRERKTDIERESKREALLTWLVCFLE